MSQKKRTKKRREDVAVKTVEGGGKGGSAAAKTRWSARFAVRLALLVLIIGLLFWARTSPAAQLLSLSELKDQRGALLAQVDDHYVSSVVIFVVVYIAVVALSIPAAAVLTLLAGFLFGTILGAVYVNVAATAGAGIVFLVARYLLGSWVQERYGERLRAFNEELRVHGHRYLLTLRLIPVIPFWLINLLAAMTKVPFRTFLWTTSLGILPGSLVYAYAGRQFGSLDSLAGLLSPGVITAFCLLALLSALPLLREKFLHKKAGGRRR